jgi:hypothetical protein
MLLALVMIGCSSDQSGFVENNGNDSEEGTDQGTDNSGLIGLVRVPVLYGIDDGPNVENLVKQGSYTSSLYLISATDGSATLIGDTGYHLTSIAYSSITNQLYGITSGSEAVGSTRYKNGTSSHSQLIAINPATGAGTAITELTLDLDAAKTVMEENSPVTVSSIQETGYGSMTINAFGTIVVWTHVVYNYGKSAEQTVALFSTVNPLTGVVTPFSFFYGGCYEGSIAFNNLGTLYLMNRYYQPFVNTINMQNGEITYQGALSNGYSDPYRYYHGDFHPLTGKFWSIDKNSEDGYQKNLLISDFNSLTQEGMIPTIDFLEAITFGYMDLNTLTLLGLTSFICDMPSNNPI